MSTGKLILLPNLLDESLLHEAFLPISVQAAVRSIEGLIAESEKAGRRYLRRFLSHDEMTRIPIRLLNEHTANLTELLEPLEQGQSWGLISDAGLPSLADPGADLVWQARTRGVKVETLAGPCSFIFALQLSGLPAQRFAFHGYLPRESPELENSIRNLEKRSKDEASTQVFIEAPYRSMKLLELLISTLHSSTKLCVAASLTTPQERVVSQTVEKWKTARLELQKEPAVFLFYRG